MEYKKIFFSYSRTDTAFAVKLALDLKKAGCDVWIDQEDIRAGSEWDMEIEKALTTCDCVVFIQSEKSAASPNVLDEVYYALEENKTVIPVIIKESKAPFRIKRLQHVDFINDYEAGLKSLKDNLSGNALPELNDQHFNNKQPLRFNLKYLFGLLLLVIIISGIFYFVRSSADKNNNDEQPIAPTEDFIGNWVLDYVQPSMQERKGYLLIDTANGKLTIKTSVQFYYPKTNDTAYLSVFNAFAECNNCTLKNEIIINDKQVDVGSRKFIVLQKDKAGKGKIGDTILNAAINTAVRTQVLLYLNKNNMHIKITKQDTTIADHGIIIPPFEYTFFFKKNM